MNAKQALRHILTLKIPQRADDLLTHHEMELHQFITEVANVAKEALGPVEVDLLRSSVAKER
tara:strand:- start:172 stop:357 length:186 start_codon:yes stop_codon:yes gene_type:complete